MAVLQKMRDRFGVLISVIIALSLLYFIAPMDDIMTLFGSNQNVVGEVDGKKVSYEDYQALVDKYTTVNEISTGSSVQNEETQEQIRNAAWQEIIDKNVFIPVAKAAGFRVGEEEMVALTTSANASPLISQNPIFANEKGEYDPANVIAFIKNVNEDATGRFKQYWNYLQNAVYTQQFYAKYGSAFMYSNIENELMASRDVDMNNTNATVDYVIKQYPFVRDSSIVVSKSEISAYYKKHKESYRQEASRDIEYVVFEVVPSPQDIAEVSDEVNNAYDEFCTTTNAKAFLLKNSDRQLSDRWYKKGELTAVNADVAEFVDSHNSGVSPIYRKGETFFAAKILELAPVSDSVYVRHILLQGAGAKHTADSLLTLVKGGADISALAAAHSVDQSSQADGKIGNIGWLTQDYMIPGLESVIDAKVGVPYVQNSRYGTHVLLVSKKTAPVIKKKVAILEKTALASKNTFNQYYAKANKFATIAAGTSEGYAKAVDSLGVYSHEQNITEATSSYGAISQAKEITRWAFDNKAGKASNIITVNNNYFFVATVKKINKEGYKSVAEVSSQIENVLYDAAVKEKHLASVKELANGKDNLADIAAALHETVIDNSEVSFATRGGSMEPAALGAAYAAPENAVAGPVKGEAGIYVLVVKEKTKGAFYTAEDAKMYQDQKNNYASRFLLPVLTESKGVKDNRARFF